MPGVTRWPNELFYGCENLARVTIPEQVAYIGQNMFWECDAIWQVKYEAIDATIAVVPVELDLLLLGNKKPHKQACAIHGKSFSPFNSMGALWTRPQ